MRLNQDQEMNSSGQSQIDGENGVSNGVESKFSRDQVIRLTLQCLKDLGLNQSLHTLEKETGLKSETDSIGQFKQILLNGRWSEMNQIIQQLKIDENNHDLFLFKLYRQYFLELLEDRNLKEALNVLRSEIAQLKTDKESLHQLSALMMCSTPEDLRAKAEWSGKNSNSRQILYSELQQLISPTMILPDRRWEVLYNQAIKWQISNCVYHCDESTNSLFTDHQCQKENFPSVCNFILEQHSDEVWFVVFSHNGRYLASSSKDHCAIVWDTQNWLVKHRFEGHDDAVCFISWSPDDSMILTCGNDSKIGLWDVETGNCLKILSKNTDAVTSASWLPDNSRFVTSSLDKSMFLWDTSGRQLMRWNGSRISDLCVTSDGKSIVAATHDKKIKIIDIETKVERQFIVSDSITSLQLAEDDKFILVNLSSSEIQLINLLNGEVSSRYTGHKQGKYVIRSSLGGLEQKFIASGSEDFNVYVWNRDKTTLLETLSGHTGTVNCVSWNPKDPHMFASASDDCSVRIWGKQQ